MPIDDRSNGGDKAQTRVLVIEDDCGIAEVIIFAFQMYLPETEVLIFTLGQEGIEAAIREMPDLCITDLNLPDMHGFDVIRKLRSVDSIPIIVASPSDDQDTVRKAIDMGADAYFKKPFSPIELLDKASNLINRRSPVLSR